MVCGETISYCKFEYVNEFSKLNSYFLSHTEILFAGGHHQSLSHSFIHSKSPFFNSHVSMFCIGEDPIWCPPGTNCMKISGNENQELTTRNPGKFSTQAIHPLDSAPSLFVMIDGTYFVFFLYN